MTFKKFSSQMKKWVLLPVFSSLIFLYSCGTSDDPNPNAPLAAIEFLNDAYGADSRQVMDVFLPAGRTLEDTPILIYIHGGAWIDGSKEEFLEFQNAFEQVLPDFAFVSINYRLYNFITDSNGFPTQENDVIAAVEHVLENQLEWNISDEIYLAGASAGGHLALLHAYKHQEIGNIQAVMALFPPTELESLHSFNFVTQSGLTALLGGTPESNPDAYFQSSPVNFVSSSTVPSIFFHGTDDTVVPISQSDLLAAELTSAGINFQYEIIEGQGHGFTPATYATVISDIAAFINSLR
jgi:acetyl esterase/lipase